MHLVKLFVIISLFFTAAFTVSAQYDDFVGITSNSDRYNDIGQLKPSWYLKTGLNLLLGIAGVTSFIFLLLGGIQWISAGGDKDAVEKARKKIVGALIGLTIVFSAYTILYVARTLFNVNIIDVQIRPLGSVSNAAAVPPPPTGNGLCGGCTGGGCGFTGVTYVGAGSLCYQCTATGWVATGASAPAGCSPQACGTCP